MLVESSEFVFVDSVMAFYTIDQHKLLTKIECYRATCISNKWFASYLSNRKQFCFIKWLQLKSS